MRVSGSPLPASDFCFLSPRANRAHGAVAQLGERVNGIHEVSGSIPLSSTSPYAPAPRGSGGSANHNVCSDVPHSVWRGRSEGARAIAREQGARTSNEMHTTKGQFGATIFRTPRRKREE